MLDDERRVLMEIEDHLRMADPAFVARMDTDGCPFPALTVLAVLWFVTAPSVSLLFGGEALAITTVVALVVTAAVVLRRRRHRADRGSAKAA